MEQDTVRCSRCVLQDGRGGITVGSDGICSVCRNHDGMYSDIDWTGRKKKLMRILDRYRGRGSGKYDCLVPFSGGKDSSYTLHLLVNEYGMKPLAFNVDNGFAAPEARQYMRDCADSLGVDLEIYRPSPDLLESVYAHAMRRTGEFCNACVVLIPNCINRAAWEKGIRLVAGSFCDMTEKIPDAYTGMDAVRFWNIMKDRFARRELERDFLFPAWKRILGIRYIDLPDYIYWDVPEIHRILASETGFPRKVSELRYDCTATEASDYLFARNTGCGKMDFLLAGLVRCGFMDREEALDILAGRDLSTPPDSLMDILAELGLPAYILEETDGLSAADYPGRAAVMRRIALMLRKGLT